LVDFYVADSIVQLFVSVYFFQCLYIVANTAVLSSGFVPSTTKSYLLWTCSETFGLWTYCFDDVI